MKTQKAFFKFTGWAAYLSLSTMIMNPAVAHAEMKSGYSIDANKLCDGYPQISVGTKEGSCVGMLVGKEDGLKMPRYAVESPRDQILYVTEMGGWAFGKGSVYAIYKVKDANGAFKTVKVDLFPTKKLTMPNGIVMDPEGRLYIGTPTGIFRFNPRNAKGEFNKDPELEVVYNKFAESMFRKSEFKNAVSYNEMKSADKNHHPLVQLAPTKDFSEMYVNLGAPSDNCNYGLLTTDENGKCLQGESERASAAVIRLKFSKDASRQVLSVENKDIEFVRGLRNSMALTVHPKSNLVMQGENSMDLKGEDEPFEELNILEQGKHYGWPYCYGRTNEAGQAEVALSPVFTKFSLSPDVCSRNYAKPAVNMPAHTAPLGLLYYQGDMFPELKNKLLVTWHGYRKYGHRVVAYNVSESGVPTSPKYEEVVFDWDTIPGIRPLGKPTGITELKDGSIIVVDDLNGAVLRISKGKPAPKVNVQTNSVFSDSVLKAFEPLVPFVKTNCTGCHTQFQGQSAQEILSAMNPSMINLKNPDQSAFYEKLKSRQMPMPPLPDAEYEKISPVLEAFIKSLK